jgi:peptidoglycan LD-endopeptidase LytH
MPTLEELLQRRTYARERPAYPDPLERRPYDREPFEPLEPALPLSERWSAVLRLLGQMGGGGLGGALGGALGGGTGALGALAQTMATPPGPSPTPMDLGGNPFRVFPVAGAGAEDFGGDWHAPRVGHLHQGTDIFAPSGTPIYAPFGGTYERGSGGIAGNYIRVQNPQRGSMFGAHLSAFPEELQEGARVRPGDVLGFVGQTGNARSTPPHLHFEYRRPGAETAIDPIGLLEALLASSGPSTRPSTTRRIPTERRRRRTVRSLQQR